MQAVHSPHTGVGPLIIESMRRFFQDETNHKLVSELIETLAIEESYTEGIEIANKEGREWRNTITLTHKY